MKNIVAVITILLTLSCKAQIVPLDTDEWEVPSGSYFKDIQNEMDKFVGTWAYTTQNETLTLTIQKRQMVYTGKHYEDLLIGEYHYVKNGVEIINTLPLLNDNMIIGHNHNISGNFFIPINLFVNCNNCSPSEKRIKLHFSDPQRDYLSVSIILRYLLNESNPNKMTATVFANDGVMLPYDGAPTSPRVPYGEYL